MHNQDPMAVEKLSDGIRRFNEDARKLEQWAANAVATRDPSTRHHVREPRVTTRSGQAIDCRPIRRFAAWPGGRRWSSCCDRSAARSAARRWPMSRRSKYAIHDAGANIAFVHGESADRSRSLVRQVRSR